MSLSNTSPCSASEPDNIAFEIANCVDCQVPFLGQLIFVVPFHSAEIIFFKSAASARSCRALAVDLQCDVDLPRPRARQDGIFQGHVAS